MRPLSALSWLALPGGGVNIPGAICLCALAAVAGSFSFLRLFSSMGSAVLDDFGGGDPISVSNSEPLAAGCNGFELVGFASALCASAFGVITRLGWGAGGSIGV